jgi:hypothetical protein
MNTLTTLSGRPFQYTVYDDGHIVVYPARAGKAQVKSAIVITPYTIELIRGAIKDTRQILMGASRDNPPPDSLGAILKREGQSPQQLSYLVPILISRGFCGAQKPNGGYWITYKGTDELSAL